MLLQESINYPRYTFNIHVLVYVCEVHVSLLLFLSVNDVPVILRLYLLPALAQLQVVDDIEPIVDLVLGVDLFVLLLPHVVLQSRVVTEGTLTVQTLKTITIRNTQCTCIIKEEERHGSSRCNRTVLNHEYFCLQKLID